MKPNFIKPYGSIPLLKQNVWEEIKTFATEEYQQVAVIQSFCKDFVNLINKARGAVTENKPLQLFQSIHTLKGIAGTLGAARLQFLTKKAEEMSLIDNDLIDEIEHCGWASLEEMRNNCG